jgi:micrococcal nuclease
MPYEYKARLKKVIDGDTIIVDIDLGFSIVLRDQNIRLSGLDTPESKSKDKIEKTFANLSRKAVEDFMKNSDKENLIIQTLYDKDNGDKFGRILGRVYNSNKTCLNDWLIDNSFAVAYNGENKESVKPQHLKNRKILIDNKIVQMSYAEAGII